MPRRIEQAPTVEKNPLSPHDDAVTFSHPAFGQVTAHRTSGGLNLYGSDFQHQQYITIRVRRSTLDRSLSTDWYHAKGELIEFALSEAQWATFVSALNVGEGTPCTILSVGREDMPAIPAREESEAFRHEVRERGKKAAERVRETIKKLDGVIGDKLSKKLKEELLTELSRLDRDLSDTIPWVVKLAEEATEKSVEKGKVEIHGYMTHALQNLGARALASLQEGGMPEAPLRLTSGGAED